MQITEKHAIAFEIAGLPAYHEPLSRESFEANYKLIAATKAALFDTTDKALVIDGPALALLTLKDEAAKREMDAQALIGELTRLTMVAKDGDLLPVSASGIDPEEWDEALSALVFFTVNYALTRKTERAQKAEALCAILGFSLISLSPEAWLSGLKTSTKGGSSKKQAASSVPV
jgi:hypothetical protein